MGIAMGCMGMSMDDFCRCAPSEFHAAYEAWSEMRQREEQGMWERMRMQCLCSLQPYSRSKLTPRDIMRFPWEAKSEEQRVESPLADKGQEELSREEIMARYREAKKRAGLS